MMTSFSRPPANAPVVSTQTASVVVADKRCEAKVCIPIYPPSVSPSVRPS